MIERAPAKPVLYDEIVIDSKAYQPGDWRKMPEVVHDERQIKGFFGEYRWLSNFGAAQVMLDDTEYPSVEVAYQAAKWRRDDRGFFETCSNEDSIRYNRENAPDKYDAAAWDEVKVDVMQFLLEQKFDPAQNPNNFQKLIETGDRYLEETNWWGDRFWGKDLEGNGENTLGRILMQIREGLRVG